MSPPLALDRFQLVVFDLDGVLVDTMPCHRRAYAELWRRLGIEGPPYEAIAGRRTADVVREVTRSLAPTAEQLREWTRFKQEHARALLDQTEVAFPDTVGSLRVLAGLGPRLAIGTGASAATAWAVVRRLEIEPLFAAIVAAEEVSAGKPSPEVYDTILDRLAVPPEDALIVEDSPAGLAAALAAGAHAVTVRSGVSVSHDRFLGPYRDLAELLGSRWTP